MHIAGDVRFGLQIERFAGVYRPFNTAIHHHMIDTNFASDIGVFRDHQHARLITRGSNVAAYRPIDAQAAAEADVTFDDGTRTDQGIDALRLGARFVVSKNDVLRNSGEGLRDIDRLR